MEATKETIEDDYRKKIVEMVAKIHNQDFLIKIYYFVKVHFEKEN